MFFCRRSEACRGRRGTVISYFLVLVSLVTTGLLMTVALTAGVETQVASITLKREQAFYAAEAGIQRALWMAKFGNWAGSGYGALTGTAGNASYSAAVVTNNGSGQITVCSTGSVTTVTPAISTSITCTLGGQYPIPAIQLGGSFSGGGGDHVTGGMMATGAISQHGNFTVTAGSVYSGSTIDSGINLDTGYGSFPNFAVPAPPDVQTIADGLKANASAVTLASTGTLDFTKSANGILVYTGSISSWKNPTIVGDGTLVVYGDVSIKSMTSFSGHNVNIVVVGSLSALGGSKFNLNGSLYVKTSIDTQSQFTVQGIILCNGGMSTQGQGSDVSVVAPPWFDPRLTSPLGGIVTTKFTGPIF